MINILKKVLIGSVLFFSLHLQSQTRHELSLESAIQYALQNNKQLQNASLAMLEAHESYKATIAQGLPQAEAKMDYQDFFNAKAFIGPMVFTFNPTSNLSFSVGQLVFNGSYIVGIQMAKLYKEITEVSYKKTDAEIKAQVTNAYTIVLISQQTMSILDKNVNNMDDVLSKTEALVKVGILDETSRDQIALQKQMLQNSVKTAERQLEMALNLLRLYLGMSADTELTLTDNLLNLMAKADIKSSQESAFALQHNADYQLMSLQKDLAYKGVLMEKVKFLPTATGFYSHTEKLKKPQLDFSPKNVIGINISIPLFTSGNRYFNHNKAKYKLLSVDNQLALVGEQLLIQERQLRYNLNSAMEQFEAQKENVELARRVYDKIYLKYQQGIVSSIDLTTANSTMLQAENSYNMSILQLLEAKTALDKLLNKL